MIKNVIFDVGEVLIEFRWKEYMEKDLHFSPEVVKKLGDTVVLSKHWSKMDRGSLDEADAPAFFKELLPEHAPEIDLFFEKIALIVKEYPYAGQMILKLKEKGYKIFLLSNYPPKMAKLHWPKFSFMKDVDGYIISGLEKMIKPEPEIYQLLLDRYRLKPEECFFFDDRPVNIEGAAKAGIAGKVFHGPEDVEELL